MGERSEFGAGIGAQPETDFVSALFAPGSLGEIAALVAREAQQRFGCRAVRLVWSVAAAAGEPRSRCHWPAAPLSRAEAAMVEAALARPEAPIAERAQAGWWQIAHVLGTRRADASVVLIADWPQAERVPEAAPGDWREFRTLVAARFASAVELADQRRAIEHLDKTARLQSALYEIADLASSELEMPEMLRRVHAVVGELMYARNFFIALYDAQRDAVRFSYFADEKAAAVDPDEEFPAQRIRDSLTLAVIRHGRPAMGPSSRLRAELGLDADPELYGPESVDWLGVPMVSGSEVRGAVVVQSYDRPGRYNEEDRALLAFVAQHILTALVRRQARGELERRVEERTHALTVEVGERKRGEKLQAALYAIADLASSQLDMGEMLRRIHAVVDELMYARNFFIVLHNVQRDTLRFIYFADERDPGIVDPDAEIPAEQMRNSVTLAVIRQGRSAMGPMPQVLELVGVPTERSMGSAAEDWLGVPMIADGEVQGAVVVQSYDRSVHYSEEDRALLAYVAQHILTALARKQAQAELERRVEDRTRELRDQIGERERAEQRLMYETLHDSLTGLPNRNFLYDALERLLARMRRDPAQHFAVLFLDLDRFKVINDSVGHLIGDRILKEAGARLATCVRAPDVVARLGGDEFALLLEDTHGPEDAVHVAQRVIDALSEPIRIDGKELFSSASVGIALSHERYTSAEQLLRDADVAMYRAKAHGRQRFEIFDERLHFEALRLLDLESDLRRAIQRSEFEPHFQPIVRLRDRHVLGYEALLRWRHPQRGLLLPGDFLAVAEENGSVEQIDWQMFDKTCAQVRSLGMNRGYVCLNVSPRHFRSPALAQQILDLLASHRLAPHRVRLEMTEGALLDNPDQVLATLDVLRDAGVLVALDDFGTGYSSLSYLHRFPLHTLKIDRSFISALELGSDGGGSSGSAAVVRAVLALARTLHMEVVAEGIETSEQCDYLREIGCKRGQGFLFSRARPASEWGAAQPRLH
ncbi:EAL domain-containing protein [Lysobacter koreensis]|uniref:EAL domain-containing protein n=2 Tax=Lysobacter koreensis TaxID=266122 RepID=A0ABW2YIX2_9GAMM